MYTYNKVYNFTEYLQSKQVERWGISYEKIFKILIILELYNLSFTF